jgi:hypothetical protein
MVPVVLVGTAGWGVAALVLLAGGAPTGWVRICLAGCLLGIPMLALMAGHDRRRGRRLRRGAGQASGLADRPGGRR